MKKLFVTQTLNPEWSPGTVDETRAYIVDKVINSTEPAIRDLVSPDELDSYCESDDWQVLIT